MALVNWCSDWDVGIAAIDAQHREMADVLNRLEAAVAAGAANESILAKLIQLTELHFALEQDLFRQANYPAGGVHTQRHGFLRLILKRVGEPLDNNRNPVADRSHLEFLRGWLMNHIDRDDRAFADYLREKEATLPSVSASCA
jgi:hemerythrin-like metal-binding protein